MLALAFVTGAFVAMALTACHTYEQVQSTPDEVWGALWCLAEAIVRDVLDLLALIAPL